MHPRIPSQSAHRGRGGPPMGGPPMGGPAAHVQTIGVRRSGFGASGRNIKVQTNHFPVTIPQGMIYHYDVILPGDKNLPAKLNLELIKTLQNERRDVFTPKAVYDGRKNLFSIRDLPLRGRDERGQPTDEFRFNFVDPAAPPPGPNTRGGPKEYRIRLTGVARINPEVLRGFLRGTQSHDNAVLTAITALNVVIRMLPVSKYPSNVRSFFTNKDTQEIGFGIVLWRGYFQSIRPGGNQMWINIDISTGAMYKPGPLIQVCLDHLEFSHPHDFQKRDFYSDNERLKLQRFISGMRVYTTHTAGQVARVIKKLTAQSAAQLQFSTRDGPKMVVADYFRRTYGKPLQFPYLPCVEVGSAALIPLEYCMVIPGQIMRKQVPSEKTKDVLRFSTQRPTDRLSSIVRGLDVFEYGQSEYLRSFGMGVNTTGGAQTIPARILAPPIVKYKGTEVIPADGQWNMRGKRLYQTGDSGGWLLIIYERESKFGQKHCTNVIHGLSKAAYAMGLQGINSNPMLRFMNSQGNIRQQLSGAGSEYKAASENEQLPKLIVAVLPETSGDVYVNIKHFGDCVAGVATQCLRARVCGDAKEQYWANVVLKINVKLGGINSISGTAPGITNFLTESTLLLGADVIHPSPGQEGRPSFTSLVGNVDKDCAKYVAKTEVQESRVEMIQQLQEMTEAIIDLVMIYRDRFHGIRTFPSRVIFYRDGVSEGQFRTVLEEEVPRIKAALHKRLRGQQIPKLTVIVVGKRHHVRFFPTSTRHEECDRSGNCKAGTVVDRDISHPTEFDFYLQSHGGLLGTSRPAHYNVLLDENRFTPDEIQQLSFALCHVYARSTRSVSIPAPVYYADIVCSRAKNHLDPGANLNIESATHTEASRALTAYKKAFRQVHPSVGINMYFS